VPGARSRKKKKKKKNMGLWNLQRLPHNHRSDDNEGRAQPAAAAAGLLLDDKNY